jgi:hypothetical protein
MPSGKSKRFATLAKLIRHSKFGLSQKPHPNKRSAIAEFGEILRQKKDIKSNVDASIEWLQAQPDFYNNCTLYQNAFFGKAITSYVLLFIIMLLSIRLPHSIYFLCMQVMILPMNIFNKRQSTFGTITQWRRILGVTSLYGVIRWNILK